MKPFQSYFHGEGNSKLELTKGRFDLTNSKKYWSHQINEN